MHSDDQLPSEGFIQQFSVKCVLCCVLKDQMKALKDERDQLEASVTRLSADKEHLTVRAADLEESQTELRRDLAEAKSEHQRLQGRLLSAQVRIRVPWAVTSITPVTECHQRHHTCLSMCVGS